MSGFVYSHACLRLAVVSTPTARSISSPCPTVHCATATRLNGFMNINESWTRLRKIKRVVFSDTRIVQFTIRLNETSKGLPLFKRKLCATPNTNRIQSSHMNRLRQDRYKPWQVWRVELNQHCSTSWFKAARR